MTTQLQLINIIIIIIIIIIKCYNRGFCWKDEENYEDIHLIKAVFRQSFNPDTFYLQVCIYASHVFTFSTLEYRMQ